MVKAKLFDKTGKSKGSIDLPKNFNGKIRKDILAKVFESQKLIYSQNYGSKEGSGAQYSASGISIKARHKWKGTYGKGISRVPRKIMSRSGASFNWVGATVSSARGGRKPHSPRSEKNVFKKINKKELLTAFNSGFVGTIDSDSIEKKYGKKIESGYIFDSSILKTKTKEFISTLNKIFKESENKILKKKSIRAGIGKMRGRKYKTNAGLLFIISSDESMKRKGIDIVKVSDLKISDLAPNGKPGRLTCYTESAIKEIQEKFK